MLTSLDCISKQVGLHTNQRGIRWIWESLGNFGRALVLVQKHLSEALKGTPSLCDKQSFVNCNKHALQYYNQELHTTLKIEYVFHYFLVMTVILIGFILSSKVPSSLMSLFVEIYAILDYLTIVCIHFTYADVFRQIVQRVCTMYTSHFRESK